MKKKFKVTVEGKTYEVEVEEVANSMPAPSLPLIQKEQMPAPVETPVVRTQSTPGQQLPAPIPGKVFKIIAKVGSAVKAGDTILILEAMKMENEITASVDGTVKEILVSEGQTVNTGDPLAVIG
jgi:biotin carboxyl carrier protein